MKTHLTGTELLALCLDLRVKLSEVAEELDVTDNMMYILLTLIIGDMRQYSPPPAQVEAVIAQLQPSVSAMFAEMLVDTSKMN